MIRLVLFIVVFAFAACSDPTPVSPHPAGKANCVLCEFLGDDKYTIADEQDAHESPDSTSVTDDDDDSTPTEEDDGTPTEEDDGTPTEEDDSTPTEEDEAQPTVPCASS